MAQPTSTDASFAVDFVFGVSEEMAAGTPECHGYDFEKNGVNLPLMMNAMMSTGFQATNLAKCVEEIRRMRKWRLSDVPIKEDEDEELKVSYCSSYLQCNSYLQCSCPEEELLNNCTRYAHKQRRPLFTHVCGTSIR